MPQPQAPSPHPDALPLPLPQLPPPPPDTGAAQQLASLPPRPPPRFREVQRKLSRKSQCSKERAREALRQELEQLCRTFFGMFPTPLHYRWAGGVGWGHVACRVLVCLCAGLLVCLCACVLVCLCACVLLVALQLCCRRGSGGSPVSQVPLFRKATVLRLGAI
jgi:hypothetical protein